MLKVPVPESVLLGSDKISKFKGLWNVVVDDCLKIKIQLLFLKEELRKELEDLELQSLDQQVMIMEQMLATNNPIPVIKTFETAGNVKSIIIIYYWKW